MRGDGRTKRGWARLINVSEALARSARDWVGLELE